MDTADRAQGDREAELAAQSHKAALEAPGAELCADCREPIPEERRRALPSAVRCISCQAFAERLARISQPRERTR